MIKSARGTAEIIAWGFNPRKEDFNSPSPIGTADMSRGCFYIRPSRWDYSKEGNTTIPRVKNPGLNIERPSGTKLSASVLIEAYELTLNY